MTAYYRLSGGGNDFLALVQPDEDPAPEQVRAWCTRGLSLGADGLFVLRRTDRGASMDYYNGDGGRAALCINGTRCAARLAFELGWAEESVTVSTGAGPIEAWADGPDRVRARLACPAPAEEVEVEVDGTSWRAWRVDVGVPHLVVAWQESLSAAPVSTLGPTLRNHRKFEPGGINVDFVRYREAHRLEIRSYERGVEAETLACGTGVLAAVRAGLDLGRCALPVTALTLGGFELDVAVAEDNRRWDLTGDARILSQGVLRAAASRLPTPPAW
jgi:diaminopimelate epimerase